MISWLQTRFQKHYSKLFLVLLGIVVITFVFTIGAMPGLGGAGHKIKELHFFDYPLTTEQDKREFFGAAQLSAYLQTGREQFDDNQLNEYAFQRAAAVHLADQLHIPGPTQEESADYLRTLGAFTGQDGKFDPQKYSKFVDDIKSNPQANEGLVAHVMTEDYRIDQVRKLLGGPGYILPDEIKQQIARANTKWTVTAASLDESQFNPQIKVTDAELQDYYKQNNFRYQVPERVQVDYVTFHADDFLSQVSAPTEAQIKSYFEANRYKYTKPGPKPADAKPGTPAPTVPAELADVHDKVAHDVKLARAKDLAAKAASDFAYNLFDQKIPEDGETLKNILKDSHLTEKSAPPFAANANPPPLPGWNHDVVEQAFTLTKKRYYSDPLTIGNDTIVLLFKDRLPSNIPPFEAIKDKVASDYRESRHHALFNEHGKELTAQLATAIKAGKSFDDAAKAAGLTTETWKDFTLKQPPQNIDYAILSRLDQLPLRQPSDMIVTDGKGEILFVASKAVPVIKSDDPDYKQAYERLSDANANMSETLLINEIVQTEVKRSGLLADN